MRSADLSPRENFEAWRASVSSLFDPSPEGSEMEAFYADLESHHLGHMLVGRCSMSPQRFHRSSALVGACGVDHFLIQLYVGGRSAYDADKALAEGSPGDIICFDLARPMRSQTSDMDTISLVVPRTMVRLIPRQLDELHGTRIPAHSAMGVLLGDHMRTLSRLAAYVRPEDCRSVAETVSLMLSSTLERSRQPDRQADSAATREAIHAFIARNLTNPHLSPEMILRQFGLSRSVLYRMFQQEGGIVETIRRRRLRLAWLKRMSVGTARGAVAKLAYSTGFSSEKAFSRAFLEEFGVCPRDAIHGAPAAGGRDIRVSDNWMQSWLDALNFGA